MIKEIKQCSKCNKQKPFSEFNKKPSAKDGFQFYCKSCQGDYIKEYRKTLEGNLRCHFYLMRNRCNNSTTAGYKNYGGRGIKCLFDSIDEFVDYVINELQIDPRGLTIDRIDNNGHYEPGNIRFVTQAENNKNKRKYRTKRLITEKQEQALRLCHQDFGGLNQDEAAKRMGISPAAIGKLLDHVEKVLPQYFPVLTKLEAKCYHLYMNEGWSVDEIAEHFGLTPNSVYKTLHRARDKGMHFTEAKGRVLSYDSSMDADVEQKF